MRVWEWEAGRERTGWSGLATWRTPGRKSNFFNVASRYLGWVEGE